MSLKSQMMGHLQSETCWYDPVSSTKVIQGAESRWMDESSSRKIQKKLYLKQKKVKYIPCDEVFPLVTYILKCIVLLHTSRWAESVHEIYFGIEVLVENI